MLEKDFLSFINENKLFTKDQSLLLAVSGGRDSMVLYHLLVKLGFKVSIAHCNFGLRGQESDGDEQFVRQHCQDAVQIFSKKFECEAYAKTHKISIQEAARTLRYDWFYSLMSEFDFLLTAHHADDRLETYLYQQIKGCGPKGYLSIPVKTHHIVRPMLGLSSSQIAEYAVQHKIQWREDSSNSHTKYARNKIRKLVIPVLKEINPGLMDTFSTQMNRLQDWNDIFEKTKTDFQSKFLKVSDGVLCIDFENALKETGYRLLLEEILKPYGFNNSQIQDLILHKKVGLCFESGTHDMTLSQKGLLIQVRKEKKEISLEIDGIGQFIQHDVRIKLEKASTASFMDPNTLFIEAKKITWPLILRKWQKGDRFRPFGMKGSKLVSDFLIDQKMDHFSKDKQLVLSYKDQILWLVGLRSSEDFKIQKTEGEFIKITFLPNRA